MCIQYRESYEYTRSSTTRVAYAVRKKCTINNGVAKDYYSSNRNPSTLEQLKTVALNGANLPTLYRCLNLCHDDYDRGCNISLSYNLGLYLCSSCSCSFSFFFCSEYSTNLCQTRL